ncbi:hypothetical protein Vadar_009557 [Vaccinium darrowii]|uniref:Uncharacterized protein n=1 Tax=Vaccinium darrowii TaxID=229202 RepID=A0ACB7Z443_9ERIC|nr:hypothetical protein Vadar_009557 [Vaccinium darrowii]
MFGGGPPTFPLLQLVPDVLSFVSCCEIDDVKAIMKDAGTAMLGAGVYSSKNCAEEAAEQATLAPLIGSSIQSAMGVVYSITSGKDITLQEVNSEYSVSGTNDLALNNLRTI